jgi:trehalose 6-phosphate phosphatase
MITAALPLTPELARRLDGRPLVLLLDIDGTLAPLAPRPEDAGVPPATRTLLTAFAAMPDVFVVAVSGRAVDDARRMVDVDGLWVIGNHGVELGEPGKPSTVRDDIASFANAIDAAANRAAKAFASDSGVLVENKRWTLSVHYRLALRERVPNVIDKTRDIGRELGLKVTLGKEVLEVRPPVDVNKGTASIELAVRLGAFAPMASLLCVGDDQTDEDMFRSVRQHDVRPVTVRVASSDDCGETSAEFRVDDPDAVRELLGATLGLRA